MNINKIVKDSVSSIKNKYDNTQLNPFKMPENINVTITIDYAKSINNLCEVIDDMDIKAMSKRLNKIKKGIDKMIDEGKLK